MINYKTDKCLPADKLFNLYESIKWTEGVIEKEEHALLIQKAYEESDLVFSAWDDSQLVGVIRAITDNTAHGIIYGLAIDPSYNVNEIANDLISKCMDTNQNIQWSADTEDWEEALFRNLGYTESNNKFLSKGNCPI